MDENGKPIKEDPNTLMAKERTRKAADRTLMAWVRTALSLIGFGVGLTSFRDILGGEREWGRPETIGMLFISIGVLSLIFAAIEYLNRTGHLVKSEYDFKKGVHYGVFVAFVIAAIGIFAIIAFFVQWLA